MKIKGISFFEQHVEKFVVGAFGVVLVGAAAMQFLTSPNRVTIENQVVEPGDIEPRLKQKADSVKSRLADASTGGRLIEEGTLPQVYAEFEKQLASGVSPRTALPPVEPALAAAILPSDVAPVDARFHVPALPAPEMVAVRQETDTLVETTVDQYPELATRFKASTGEASGPFDITWATPVAVIDLAAIRSELHRADPSAKPPEIAVPTLWFNDAIWTVDLVFERQERRPDGTWGDPALVSTLPGQFTFRKELPTADAGLRDAVFNYLNQRDKVLEILQPEFLATKGNVFSPATVLGQVDSTGATGEDPALRRLKQQYSRRKADRDRIEAQLKEAGGPLEPEKPEDRKKDRGTDGSGSGSGSGGGGGGGKNAPPGGGAGGGGLSGGGGFGKNNQGAGAGKANDEATKKKRIALTQRLKLMDAELAGLEEQITKLGPATDLKAAGGSNLLDLAKDESVTVWAHDLDVHAGSTYRYRSRIDLYNPFFTRKRQLVADQQPLADSFLLKSAPSEWSEPVTIEPPVTFFVADAVAGEGRLGLGYAKIELYRFHDGERRLETVVVQPGDRIAASTERARGNETPVDFSTEWFVVDVVEDSASDRGERRGANVVVRRMGDSGLEVRSPKADMADEDRIRFNDESESARTAALGKGKGKDAPGDDSAPPSKGSGPGSGPGGAPGGGPKSPK